MDTQRVRRILSRDPVWGAYALGDLAPERLGFARWYATPRDTALVLVYEEFETPILFTFGDASAVSPLLDSISLPRKLLLQVRPDIVPLIAAHGFDVTKTSMLRMVLARAAAPSPRAELLTTASAAELADLYADGAETGESPDFFHASMLAGGTFFGIRAGGKLAAAAGTHLVCEQEGVAAIGNVYTHRAWRNIGFAGECVASVTAELGRRGIRVQVLNVSKKNMTAIRVYRRLSFTPHCEFFEGVAHKVVPNSSAAIR
ncbi:MAG: GNAT family N-acetyltransferase [Candidatus Solibacter usitatus]|nr:GNAT family N-acetyltransferase [Candidatus Solibacter usitatus]